MTTYQDFYKVVSVYREELEDVLNSLAEEGWKILRIFPMQEQIVVITAKGGYKK